MNCFLFGNGSLTIDCGHRLLGRGHRIEGVITSAQSVREWADDHSVAAIESGPDLASRLNETSFDLLLSVAYLSIIPKSVIRLPEIAAINFHDGPLPAYAGINVPVWALMNQERRHGITWHLMDEKADAGDILLTRGFDVAPDETALSLNLKCYQAGIDTFEELLSAVEQSRLNSRRQDLSARRYFSLGRRPEAACMLMIDGSAETLVASVRALDFGDYANPLGLPKLKMGRDSLVVRSAVVAEAASGDKPRTIVHAREGAIQLATSSGDILITSLVSPEGVPAEVPSILEREDLSPGDLLPGVNTAVADKLTGLYSEVCLKEATWVERLSGLIGPRIPMVQRSSTEATVGIRTLDMTVPSTFGAYPGVSGSEGNKIAWIAAAFAAYLSRITGEDTLDLAFRDTELGRRVELVEDVFSSHVPLRFICRQTDPFGDLVSDLVRTLERTRLNLTFARDVVMRYPQLRSLRGAGPCGGLKVVFEAVESLEDYRPLAGNTLTVLCEKDGRVRWHFDESVLTPEDARRMQGQFEAFLESVASRPDTRIGEHDILPSDQRRQLLADWNATTTEYSAESCVHDLIRAQAARTPDAVAVVFEDVELTYTQLNERANQFARELQRQGAMAGGVVGVYLRRSLEMVVSVLAILKTGAAYLPLDPEFPADRIGFMIEDAEASAIVTTSELAGGLDGFSGRLLRHDVDKKEIDQQSNVNLSPYGSPSSLAYVIYTSGSTGKPKGVLIEHRNAVNFFAGMDAKIEHDPPGVWLAVTSLSFDISVLELLWTLTRGFKVVLSEETNRSVSARTPRAATATGASATELSLFYFSSDESEQSSDKYRLLLEGARFADENGFAAVWTPERHFDRFGGLYPNPSVTCAAVAAVTKRVGIRAGSCVLPLHSSVRVAEEWAVVDNISQGRVGIAFASGWHPGDFVFKPEHFAERQAIMLDQIATVQRLWRGERVRLKDGRGEEVEIGTLPRPVQSELPIWITAAGNPETFRLAGERGFNLLTHLLGQSLDELRDKVAIYRQAREEARPSTGGQVALMLHTFLGQSRDEVREQVRGPMKDYLRSAIDLVEKAAWSFPTFKQRTDQNSEFRLDHLTEGEMDAVLDFAFERYFDTSGLFGAPADCLELLDEVGQMGVDEVACLIDFGVPTDDVLGHLGYLNELRLMIRGQSALQDANSIPTLIAKHGVTHLQCTPSMMTLFLADDRTRTALAGLRQIMVGGEVLPATQASDLRSCTTAEILNMYGPTETTIWSSVYSVSGQETPVPIGRPIANTRLYVLDRYLQPVPIGVVGELFIGGNGVARGYHNRPELTAEKFVKSPFAGQGTEEKLYRTGDLVRYLPSGDLEILGRSDHQVKIRGYRIELGEVESALERHPEIRKAVVVVHEDLEVHKRLIAYLQPSGSGVPTAQVLRELLATSLPAYMIPSVFVQVEAFPLTPNKKIDRKGLPSPNSADSIVVSRDEVSIPAPSSEMERLLQGIWGEVLESPQVGIDDNFFDLGGHSLLAVKVNRLVARHLSKDVPLTDLFRFPTVRLLARHLDPGSPESGATSGPVRATAKRVSARQAARSELIARRPRRSTMRKVVR